MTLFLNGTRGFNSPSIIPPRRLGNHSAPPPRVPPLTDRDRHLLAEALLKRNPASKIGGGLIIAGLGVLELLLEPDKED